MKETLRLTARVLLPVLLVYLALVLLPRLFVFFFPFVLGAFIAFLSNPLVRFLHDRTKLMQRPQASGLILILLLSLTAGIGYLFVIIALRFTGYFLTDSQALLQELSRTLQELSSGKGHIFDGLMHLPFFETLDFPTLLKRFTEQATGQLAQLSGAMAGTSLYIVRSIPSALVYLVVTILSAYCFSKDGDTYLYKLKQLLPGTILQYMRLLRRDVLHIIHVWLMAQFKLMFFVFLTLFIGLSVIHSAFALPLSILTAFLDFLPMLGVGFIFWPWILYALFCGELLLALQLIVIYILTQVVRQFLQPKIMGDTMGLSPMKTLLYLFLGFRFLGFLGLILAMPFGLLLQKLYEYGVFHPFLSDLRTLFQRIKNEIYS